MKVKIHIDPDAILLAHGLNDGGKVQQWFTENVNKRITEYLPYRSGTLAERSRHVTSPTEITIFAPYARYQYYGKVMVGKPPKQATDIDLNYDQTKHSKAGPFWDRRMMAEQGAELIAELKERIRREMQK